MAEQIIDTKTITKDALLQAADDKGNKFDVADVNKVNKIVGPMIDKEVNKQMSAVVENVTNNEPWYKSRVIVGLIISLLFKVLGLALPSLKLSDDDASQITGVVLLLISALGDLYALYGRTIAKNSPPIGG